MLEMKTVVPGTLMLHSEGDYHKEINKLGFVVNTKPNPE